MTSDINAEDSTIEIALIFYRQYLIKELQNCEIDFSGNGSLPFAREDVQRQDAYHRQLQKVVAILESRRQRQENLPVQSTDLSASIKPTYGAFHEKDTGHEPYINPSTGQQYPPDTRNTQAPSRSPSLPRNVKFEGEIQPEAQQIRREPATPRVFLARQNSAHSLPEAFVPAGTGPSRSGSANLPTSQRNDLATMMDGSGPSSVSVGSQGGQVAEIYKESDGQPITVNKPVAENVTPVSPTAVHNRQESSLLSAAWSNINSESERPIPPSSPSHEKGPESYINLGPPLSISKRGSPASSVTSCERRHVSTPSVSTDELVDRPSSTTASYPKQQSPATPPPQTPKVRLRPQPTFNVLDSGKFANSVGNGIKPISSSQTERNSRSQAHGRLPSGDLTSSSLPLHSKHRKPLNTTVTSSFPGAQGERKPFPPLASPSQTEERAEFQLPRLASDSDTFTLPIFSNEDKAADRYLGGSDGNVKVRPDDDVQQNQVVSQGSTSFRSASDSRILNQYQSLNNRSRNFSSQTSFTPSPNSLIANPFQSKSSFNGEPEYLSPSTHGPPAGSSPNIPNGITPNYLTSTGPELKYDFQTRQYVSDKPSLGRPERLAPAVSKHLNGISPNQLKPTGFDPGQTIDLGQSSPERTPQDQATIRSSGHKGSLVANQINPNNIKEVVASENHRRKSRIDPYPGKQESLSSTHSASNLHEEQQLAQIIADLAEQDEMASLKKIEHDWNCEEDRREAREYSMLQNLQNDFTTSRRVNDSVQFPASSSSFKPPSSIIVQPVRSIPTQARRAAPRPDSNVTTEKLKDHARSAISRISIPSQVSSNTASSREQYTNDGAMKKSECTVCRDTLITPSETATLPCNHTYHPRCLASGFQHALAGGKLFVCCDSLPAPIDTVTSLLTPQFVANYKAKIVERSTPNPIYCARPGCASFIPPANITGPLAKCGECGFVTCKMCRNPEHKGVCPPDKDGGMLMRLAGNKKWCQCQRCKSMVERDEGCLHMTCSCGHEFCYNCGGVWATCGGKCERKS